MAKLQITMLGAGQDVGRSCVVVTFPSRRLLFDCGAHCGFVDHRRYPDLQLLGDVKVYNTLYNTQMDALLDNQSNITPSEATEADKSTLNVPDTPEAQEQVDASRDRNFQTATIMKNALKTSLDNVTSYIDCSIISHFHLDHIGALPFLTEHLGYKGPVYMTYPTRGLAPILLRDSAQVVASKFRNTVDTEGSSRGLNTLLNRKKKRKPITVEQLEKLDPWGYTIDCVAESLHKAHVMQLKSTQSLGNIKITPYYAGHVLGAAMFHVECDGFKVLYTGDFNTAPDKHLGPARVPPLQPDVLICESTYASVVRQPRRATEMELCTVVHDCLLAGGKVLIPVFAVGRAQELAIILDTYWTKLQLKFPIYFGGGLSERATSYYKLHSAWTDSKNIPNIAENTFKLKNMLPFDNRLINDDKPMVLFATPGMVHSGLSLKVCKLWAPNPKNLILIPGYAVQGTVGNKLISGEKVIQTGTGSFEVKCKVRYLSFSAHADSAGIMRLIKQVRPKNLVLVHGEYEGMKAFAKHIAMELGIPVSHPANGQTIYIKKQNAEDKVTVYYSPEMLLEASGLLRRNEEGTSDFGIKELQDPPDQVPSFIFTLPNEVKQEAIRENMKIVLSRNHMVSLLRERSQESRIIAKVHVHRIKHRRKLTMMANKFCEIINFIKALKEGKSSHFADDLPIYTETQDSRVKIFKVGELEAQHRTEDNTVLLQWYNHEMQRDSIVYTIVLLFQRLSE